MMLDIILISCSLESNVQALRQGDSCMLAYILEQLFFVCSLLTPTAGALCIAATKMTQIFVMCTDTKLEFKVTQLYGRFSPVLI